MNFLRAVFFSGFFVVCFAWSAAAANTSGSAKDLEWRVLEPGLELARVVIRSAPPAADSSLREDEEALERLGLAVGGPSAPQARMSVLRIDPERYVFSLHMASESGVRSLASIGKGEDLVAAVNAGMYLPDHSTSTGYLRGGAHTNNPRVAAGYGAFFVAEPYDDSLPRARFLDRTKDDWENILPQYRLVMQNYRMTTAEGRIIWKQPERSYSIAALSQDASGRVLFLLCAMPVPALDFITTVLESSLGVKSLMYLEGGSEAALLVRAGGMDAVEAGRHPSGLWGGSANILLPNVLGVGRRR